MIDEVCLIFERINSFGIWLLIYDFMVVVIWVEDFDFNEKVSVIFVFIEVKGYGEMECFIIFKLVLVV